MLKMEILGLILILKVCNSKTFRGLGIFLARRCAHSSTYWMAGSLNYWGYLTTEFLSGTPLEDSEP